MQTRFKFYPIKKNEIKSYSFYRSNVYKHARTAVYAFGGLGNATCVVNGTNPNIPFPLTSFGLQASDFINCHLGINSRSNANNIYNNIMSCIGGVKVVNSKYPYQTLLNNNFISASSYGIQLIDNKNSLQIMCNHNYVYMHPVLNTTKPAGYGIAAYENVINYNQINIHHNTIQCNSSTVGIYFYNTTQANTVHCNQIDTCRAGVHFTNNSDIGTQGSLTAAQENTWHFPTSNYFAFRNDLTCPNPTWYVRNGATGLPYKLTTIQKFPTSFVSLPYGTQVNDCEVPCPDCNNQRMAEIVTEQGSFATLSDEVKYQAKKGVYELLDADSTYMNAGLPSDAVLQNFYDSARFTNMGLLNDVTLLIQDSANFLANAINSWVSPINHFEENTKQVNQIYLATWAEDISEFDSLQYETLYTIATENAATGGNAVYAARVMLGLDFNDEASANRTIYSEVNGGSAKQPVSLIPNPAKDKITIGYDLPNENATLTIYDNHGIQVEAISIKGEGFYSENQIEVKNLSAGLCDYLIVEGLNINHTTGKFLIVK